MLGRKIGKIAADLPGQVLGVVGMGDIGLTVVQEGRLGSGHGKNIIQSKTKASGEGGSPTRRSIPSGLRLVNVARRKLVDECFNQCNRSRSGSRVNIRRSRKRARN
jgi:hypothetical protein